MNMYHNEQKQFMTVW